MKQLHSKLLVGCLLVLGAVGFGSYYVYDSLAAHESGPIYNYDRARDHDDIIKLFELERFWLTVSDYDPVFMLKYMAPYKGAQHKNTLHVWVAREGKDFVGFTACYFENPTVARVLFLATNPEFRGKGYGRKLLQRAFVELKKLGADMITIVTRNSNIPAQSLYSHIGFVETMRDQGDSGHVYYEYAV